MSGFINRWILNWKKLIKAAFTCNLQTVLKRMQRTVGDCPSHTCYDMGRNFISARRRGTYDKHLRGITWHGGDHIPTLLRACGIKSKYSPGHLTQTFAFSRAANPEICSANDRILSNTTVNVQISFLFLKHMLRQQVKLTVDSTVNKEQPERDNRPSVQNGNLKVDCIVYVSLVRGIRTQKENSVQAFLLKEINKKGNKKGNKK